MWLSAKVPRDAAFAAQVQEICDLYTRPLPGDEMVLCVDEMTSCSPGRESRRHWQPTESADPGRTRIRPVRSIESVRGFRYAERQGLRATAGRKRQAEFIAFLEYLDTEIPASVKTIQIVLDNLRMHKGKQVQAWLAKHPRFVFHHPPVHCSWMNQVEQWFSILRRKRLRIWISPTRRNWPSG